jgi:hypothetical protein
MLLLISREEIICQPSYNQQPKAVYSKLTSVGRDRMISEYLAFVRHRLTTNTVRGPHHWEIRAEVLEPLLLSFV